MHDQGAFVGLSYSPEMLQNYSSHGSISKMSVNRYKKKLQGRFDRFGGFEFPIITNDSGDSVNHSPTNLAADSSGTGGSLCSTNANERKYDRVGVEFAGEVPRQGLHAVMYQKKFLDWPIAIGLSSWASSN